MLTYIIGDLGKGLASHLQVPLPYLLYRAQARYEDDLRGLQGIQTSLSNQSAISPTSQAGPSHGPIIPTSPPANLLKLPGEDVSSASTPERLTFPRKESQKFGGGGSTSTARPLPIRTRLNSLSARSMNSPHRVTSSSVITLQGPKRQHTTRLPLTPPISRASRSSPGSSADESSEDDEDQRKLDEEEKRAEEQAALEQKLKDLTLKLTKDRLGLVSSPPKNKGKGKETDRGRIRPLSASSVSGSHHQLEMSRRNSHTPSHHSLSSTSSRQGSGSIPSIPSPPPEARSQPQSPMARHLSPGGKSTSPPAVALNTAWATRNQVLGKARTSGKVRSDIGSEMGSTASSFSDFSGKSMPRFLFCPS